MPAVGVDGAVVWPWCDRPQDGFSFACSVRVDATDQAPAWEREVADWWPSPNALVAGEGTVILTGSLHSFAPKRFGPVKLTGPGDGGYALALRR